MDLFYDFGDDNEKSKIPNEPKKPRKLQMTE